MGVLRSSVSILCILVSNASIAQSQGGILKKDSIPQKLLRYAADKFPSTRVLNIEYSHVAPYNYSSKWENRVLPESRVTDMYQARLSANLNFIKKQQWIFGIGINYRYISSTATLTDPGSGLNKIHKEDYHYHTSSMNLAYFSKLFNKTAIYSASLLVDGSEKDFERVKGYLIGNIILKANARTKIMVGLLVNIDPSSQNPVLPIFTYEHKFSNGLVADINLPRNILLRKNVFGNGRVSLGTQLESTGFYLYNVNNSPQKFEFRQTEINSGIIYEHLIGNHFILTAKTGVKIVPNARVFKKVESFGDYIFEAKPDPAFYFNLGVSFNPFAKAKKK